MKKGDPIKEDPIMAELRQVRRTLLKEAGGDLAKLLERANREAPLLLAKVRKPIRSRQPSHRGA